MIDWEIAEKLKAQDAAKRQKESNQNVGDGGSTGGGDGSFVERSHGGIKPTCGSFSGRQQVPLITPKANMDNIELKAVSADTEDEEDETGRSAID